MTAAGFTEVVASVVDIDRARAVFESVCGYQGHPLPDAGPALFEAWAVPDACTRIAQHLLVPENDTRGTIRLVQFHGVEREPMRPSQRVWDSGGLFDIDVYVRDAHAITRQLQQHGWLGFGEPVRYSWGGFEVVQWLAQTPDGLAIGLLQPLGKVLVDLPPYRAMSRAFNAAQVVQDLDRSLAFYLEDLGWQLFLQDEVEGVEEPGRDVMGIPMPLAKSVRRRIAMVHPGGINDGSVELIEMREIAGRHWGGRCHAPNLGWLAVRIPVADARAYAATLVDRGVSLATPPLSVSLEPDGEVTLFAVESPDGARLEFFSG